MTPFKDFCDELEREIEKTYTDGVTLSQAEALAAKFLKAQLLVSTELRKADLESRMRKSGVKGIKAAVYLAEVQGKDKKPTESQLEHTINTDPDVSKEQDRLDEAETDKSELERIYSIFVNAHIYYRAIGKNG